MKRGKRGDLGDLDNRGKLGDREKRGRRFLVAALVFAFLFSGSGNVWAQSPSPHLMMPIDLVLVLDTSAGMSFSYNEVLDYITGPFLREFLRVGDTFHLITFASAPALCISRRISGIGDIETVIGRMLLHPPLGAYASLEGALAFAESFVQSLPASRPGEVVLLSSAVGAASLVEGSRQRLSESGANLHFVAVGRGGDLAGLPASGRPSAVAAPPAAVAPPPAVVAPPAVVTPPPVAVAPPAVAVAPPAVAPPVVAAPPAVVAPPPVAVAPPAVTAPPVVAPPPVVVAPPPVAAPPVVAPPPAVAAPPPVAVAPPAVAAPPAAGSPVIIVPTQPQWTTPPDASAQVPPAVAAQPVPAAPPALPAALPTASPPAALPTDAVSGRGGLVFHIFGIIAIFAAASLATLLFFAVCRSRIKLSGFQPQPLPAGMPAAVAAAPVPAATPAVAAAVVAPRVLRTFNVPAAAPPATPAAPAPGSGGGAKRRIELPKYTPLQATVQAIAESHSASASAAASAASEAAGSGSPALVNLFVEDQNTAIGKRNTHSLKQGVSFTVGGGNSDFLICLVPLPAAIGEIRREGGSFRFIPNRPKYFPDIGSGGLNDCVNKTIRIVTERGREVKMKFVFSDNPAEKLNSRLASLKMPV